MSIRSSIRRLLSIGSRRQQVVLEDSSPQLVDWPVSETPLKLRPVVQRDTNVPAGITVLANPFAKPEIAEFVREAWCSSPDARFVTDGKYCEFTSQNGST